MSWNLWSIASSAQALATQSLDKVYEILEPPKIDSDDEIENPELNEQPPASEPVDRSKEPEKAPEGAASSEASKGLFSTWNSVIEIGSHLAQDLTNSELVKEGLGFGEAIFQQTLVTLETVGKTTMDTVAAVVDTRDKTGPSSSAPEPLFKFPVAFAKEFEDRAGHAHLMAMESLANECNSKVKTISQTLASNESLLGVKKQIEKDAKSVAAFFNVENASDEIENSKEFQILSDESYAAVQQHLKTLDVPSFNQLKEFQDLVREVEKSLQDLLLTFRKDLGEAKGETLANEEQVTELTKQTLKKIHGHAMVALAKGTAKTLEQLLRISEILIMKLEKKAEGKPLTPAEVSKSAREIVIFLLKENYCITSIHVKVVEQVSTEAKAHLDKLFEQVEAEESSTTNALYVDIGDAIPFIQDGLQHLHPVVKLMIFEEGFRGAVKPTEAAKAPESPKTPESPKAPESPKTPEAPQQETEKVQEAEKQEAEEPKATETQEDAAQEQAPDQVTEEEAAEEPAN